MTAHSQTEGNLFALWRAKAGDSVRVRRFRGGAGMTARLAEMGVLPGAVLKVVRAEHQGPVVVEIRGGKVIIGHGMAERIIVEPYGKAESSKV